MSRDHGAVLQSEQQSETLSKKLKEKGGRKEGREGENKTASNIFSSLITDVAPLQFHIIHITIY